MKSSLFIKGGRRWAAAYLLRLPSEPNGPCATSGGAFSACHDTAVRAVVLEPRSRTTAVSRDSTLDIMSANFIARTFYQGANRCECCTPCCEWVISRNPCGFIPKCWG